MSDLIDEARNRASMWLKSPIDSKTKHKIKALLRDENQDELISCFYKNMEFGTGGLRGIMRIGSNGMNQYTVGITTQGLSHYLKKSYPNENIEVAIAYDSRHNSKEFADITAHVLSANGILAHLFSELRPTPILSFAVRHLGCHAGVVITASHNPKEYNGYKVCGADGAQLVSPQAEQVLKEVRAIDFPDRVLFHADHAKIRPIDKEVEEAYFHYVEEKLASEKDGIARQRDLRIIYSGLHGSGVTMIPECLSRIGFTQCIVVPEQKEPNGDFPTVRSPNPEDPDSMEKALTLAHKLDAELVMATDPDADRVGIGIRKPEGGFVLLNGNQALSLIVQYALSKKRAVQHDYYIVKTIVTTELIDAMASKYGVACYNTLTGFKYIAEQIRKQEGKKIFLAAGEESYGFLTGDFVRDKDAVSACAFFASMAAASKDKGHTLYDDLIQLYLQYGLYKEDLFTLVKEGIKGEKQIRTIMDRLRHSPPATLYHEKVVRIMDFKKRKETDTITGEHKALTLPSSDVLQFYTEKGTKVSIRPSGTEPKIKLYFSVKAELKTASEYENVSMQLDQKIKCLQQEFIL